MQLSGCFLRKKHKRGGEVVFKELAKRPDPVQFFDGSVCPLCERVLLNKDDFIPLVSKHQKAYAFLLDCYCMKVLADSAETTLVGVILESDAQPRIGIDPGFFLANFVEDFTCPQCETKPKVADLRIPISRGRIYTLDLKCRESKCSKTSRIVVVYKRYGHDSTPNEVHTLDRTPPRAALAGPATTNEFLEIHETSLTLFESFWLEVTKPLVDRVHPWRA